LPRGPPCDVDPAFSELYIGPLEVCGLPRLVPTGLLLGERATHFDLTIARGIDGGHDGILYVVDLDRNIKVKFVIGELTGRSWTVFVTYN
jgi:hypothetical protein